MTRAVQPAKDSIDQDTLHAVGIQWHWVTMPYKIIVCYLQYSLKPARQILIHVRMWRQSFAWWQICHQQSIKQQAYGFKIEDLGNMKIKIQIQSSLALSKTGSIPEPVVILSSVSKETRGKI